jgi:hypothetical protein
MIMHLSISIRLSKLKSTVEFSKESNREAIAGSDGRLSDHRTAWKVDRIPRSHVARLLLRIGETLFHRPPPVSAMTGDEDERVEAIRKRTKAPVTHPERVLFPAAGLTKLDVIEYYLGVGPFLLPYLRDRPLTLHRFPGGVGTAGFYEKDAPAGTPAFVETFTHWAEAPGRDVDFVLGNNPDTLAWLANIAAIEVHATLSQAGS